MALADNADFEDRPTVEFVFVPQGRYIEPIKLEFAFMHSRVGGQRRVQRDLKFKI